MGGNIHVSMGDWDAFVAVLADGGEPSSSVAFGETGQQTAAAVAVAPDGGVLVGGSYFQAINLGIGTVPSAGADDVFVARLSPSGGVTWANRYGDPQSQQLADLSVDALGGIILAGSFAGVLSFGPNTLVSAGATDVFVAKLDEGGIGIWGRRFGDAAVQLARELMVTPFGGVVVVGEYSGAIDFGQGVLPFAGSSDVFVAALPP
jgi:hypothetical protein